MNFKRLLFFIFAALTLTNAAQAGESQFGYVYTTDLLPKGKKEIEQWMTWRHQKSQGTFDVWEGRTEFEYGVSENVQLAAYANYAKTHAYHDGVDGATAPPETFAETQVAPDTNYSDTKFIGGSLEAIYRVLSPYKDPIGLAFYLEPTVGRGLRKLEERMIIQKNFLDDTLVLGTNVTVEQEGRWLPADPSADPDSEEAVDHWDHETDLNIGVAASYRFIANWSAGFELLNEREFSSFNIIDGSTRTNDAYYLGPTLHYGGKRFFVTAVFLKQMPWAKDYGSPAPGFIVDGRNYADDFEKYRVRVKIGIPF
jgi:hypothetical protein